MKRLVIDTETTGLSPNINKTLTVGLLLIDVEKDFLDILDSSHVFVKHDNYNTTKEAMTVNKIDLVQHELHAVPQKKACHQINRFIEKNVLHEIPLVGHNIAFDRGFLNSLFDQGETFHKFNHESEDTMWMWRNLQRKNLVPWNLRSNLQTIADFFKIDYTKSHDALADCEITAQVYHKLLGLSQ
ncbi:MAG: 3'-5' exonuclease [Nanoarchaeota archaeon]|nr:3'-5' exonuclease [Nanoarchaeota archaeon]